MGPLIGVHRTVGMPGRHASAEAKLQHAFTNRNELTNADGGVDGAAVPRRQNHLGQPAQASPPGGSVVPSESPAA